MTPTSPRSTLAAALGLVALTGCIGELDIGKKPGLDQSSDSDDASGGSDDAGPGMTSSTPPGTTTANANGDDDTSTGGDDTTTGDDTTGGGPSEVTPPCELGEPGPGHDPAVQWGVVCGGTKQEYIQSIAMDSTGAIYVSTQVEGQGVTATLVMGDDEIPLGAQPLLLVTKLSPEGEILWNRWFDGEDTWWWGGSIAVCDDRVMLVASRSGPPELIDFGTGIVDGNMAVVAFDLDGQTQWATATGQDDELSGGFPVGSVSCRGENAVIRGVTAVDLTIDDVTLDGNVNTASNGYVVVLDNDGNASWGTIEATYNSTAALGPAGELVTLGYAMDAVALTRYDVNGTLEWRQDFPITGSVLLTSVDIDDAGNITIGGTFTEELDFGQGLLVNIDPPEDPLDPTDDWLKQDGFVSRHDSSGAALWTTAIATVGFDYARVAYLAANGSPVVHWNTSTQSHLVAVDNAGSAPVAALPGTYLMHAVGHPSGGIGLAWSDPSTLTPFSPPLTLRGPYDFTLTRLVP